MKSLSLALLTFISTSAVFADKAPQAYFAADSVLTLQGELEAADRYQQSDFNRFVAGDGFVISEVDGDNVQGANATLKGIACFDLEKSGMRAALTNTNGQNLAVSFALEQIKGKPRPLRVEFVGTFKDVTQEKSLKQIFEASSITEANDALSVSAQVGLHTVDLTEITKAELEKRWLVIRFEEQGLRIENTGEDDLYQFNSTADTVRLTLASKEAMDKTVAQHYTASGYYNLLPDMPSNLTPDESSNLTPDESSNLDSDMSSDLTPDMSKDLTPDLSKNLIDDGGN